MGSRKPTYPVSLCTKIVTLQSTYAIGHIPLGHAFSSDALNGPLSTLKEVLERRFGVSGRTVEADFQSHRIHVYKNDDLRKPHNLRLNNLPVPFPRCNSNLRLSFTLLPD